MNGFRILELNANLPKVDLTESSTTLFNVLFFLIRVYNLNFEGYRTSKWTRNLNKYYYLTRAPNYLTNTNQLGWVMKMIARNN